MQFLRIFAAVLSLAALVGCDEQRELEPNPIQYALGDLQAFEFTVTPRRTDTALLANGVDTIDIAVVLPRDVTNRNLVLVASSGSFFDPVKQLQADSSKLSLTTWTRVGDSLEVETFLKVGSTSGKLMLTATTGNVTLTRTVGLGVSLADKVVIDPFYEIKTNSGNLVELVVSATLTTTGGSVSKGIGVSFSSENSALMFSGGGRAKTDASGRAQVTLRFNRSQVTESTVSIVAKQADPEVQSEPTSLRVPPVAGNPTPSLGGST